MPPISPYPAFALHSHHVVFPDGTREATLLIRDGLIHAVIEGRPDDLSVPMEDVGQYTVMPGVVDPHVHINEPGRTDWEGFRTATMAAIAGGLTTLVDMPLNSSPVTTTAAAFDAKLDAAAGQLHCNCGFWGGIVPGNTHEIEPLIDKGVLGFKAFLIHSGIDEFPPVRESDLNKAMPILAKYDLPLLVHCELPPAGPLPGNPPGMDPKAGSDLNDPRSYKAYLASRPPAWEDNAIALMIRLCRQFRCRTHIVHLSSGNSVDQVRQAKKEGLPLTAETAQHYLHFSAGQIGDGQTLFKCAPPIRDERNQDLLWEGLLDGTIDLVATDHSPAPPELKATESGDFVKAWGGISSLQLALPLLWTAARRRGCSLSQLVKWLCSGPASLIGQPVTRGALAPGREADLVVWEPEEEFRVEAGHLYHRHKRTPYEGEQLYGVVKQTWLHGVKVFDEGAFPEPPKGKIILRNR